MITKRAKRELLDRLHRGFVWTMIGVTVLGFGGLCLNTYAFIQNAKQKEKLMLANLKTEEESTDFPVVQQRIPRTTLH